MRKLKAKSINFYARFTEKPKRTEKRTVNLKLAGILGGVAAIGLLTALYVWRTSELDDLKQEYILLKQQTDDAVLLDTLEKTNWLSERVEVYDQIMEDQQKDVDAIGNADSLLSHISPSLLDNVLGCQTDTIHVTGISYSDGYLYVEGTASAPAEASAYIEALNRTAIFQNVGYGGFTAENGAYTFTAIARF